LARQSRGKTTGISEFHVVVYQEGTLISQVFGAVGLCDTANKTALFLGFHTLNKKGNAPSWRWKTVINIPR
jgi:hypothetical protein